MPFRMPLAVLLLALTGCQAQSEPFPSSSKLAPAKVKAIAATITKRHPNLSAEQHDAVLRTVVRSLDEMVFIEGGEFDMGDFGWPCDRALTELCEWPCGVPLDQLCVITENMEDSGVHPVRLSNFHTAPTCSPTRAMMLSGADSHVAGLGNMGELLQPFQQGQPGYEGYLNERMVTVGQVLQDAGYNTYTTGKWHLGRTEETSPKARGFDRSFILVQGGASHFDDQHAIIAKDPKAIYREDGKQVEVPKGFYSSEFYTDRLIDYIEADKASNKPFMALLSYTAPHWPLHAPDDWLDTYKGRYDGGYEPIRQARLQRQKQLGLVAADTVPNTPMSKGLPDWNQLSPEQRQREARNMEIYAAMVSNMDYHIGRLLQYL